MRVQENGANDRDNHDTQGAKGDTTGLPAAHGSLGRGQPDLAPLGGRQPREFGRGVLRIAEPVKEKRIGPPSPWEALRPAV